MSNNALHGWFAGERLKMPGQTEPSIEEVQLGKGQIACDFLRKLGTNGPRRIFVRRGNFSETSLDTRAIPKIPCIPYLRTRRSDEPVRSHSWNCER